MIRAFGYCDQTFDPATPDRLCRGRERWLDDQPEGQPPLLHRTICSGATFTDDSARDAIRGLPSSGVDAGALLSAIFPRRPFAAFSEQGDPRALPDTLWLEEEFVAALHGGKRQTPAVRWVAPARATDIAPWIAGERDGLAGPHVDGILVGATAVTPGLSEALFRLCGYAQREDRPALRYVPSAIPEVLEHCHAVVLLHLDKHAPAIGIYTHEPLESAGTLELVARAAGAFPVPFDIPPMLARWDRAIADLRARWDEALDGEFPVPPAEDGRYGRRRRRTVETQVAAGEE